MVFLICSKESLYCAKKRDMETTAFRTLHLSRAMLHNLQELGYTAMTPVQAQSLPFILQGNDAIVRAKTGSGKTAAFGIGIVTRLDVGMSRVQALVLCPTRELADQVAKELRRLARSVSNVKILTLCGGTAFSPQVGSLRHGAHVVVGTPGRIQQHIDHGSLRLDAIHTLVLDEADRMLDMGFVEAIGKIVSHLPVRRQTLLFSATFPESIMTLSAGMQQEPVHIQTVDAEGHEITERFYRVGSDAKFDTLIAILTTYRPARSLVFCNTKIEARNLAHELCECGIDALAIHGDLEQYERTDVLVRFANRSCPVLVATDVAARGLDIEALEAVINYDMPRDEAGYTHRIGRTGRAGETGSAFTLFTPEEAGEIEGYRNETRRFEDAGTLDHDAEMTLQAPNVTLVIEGGKKQKLRPGDILGALTGEAGIDNRYIGKIDIFERQSYVAIDRSVSEPAYRRLKAGRVKGRRFSIWMLES